MNPLMKQKDNQQPDIRQAIGQIKKDPGVFLSRAGLNVPQGMSDPQTIINHLVQSGQVPQARVNQMMQMLGGARR